MVAAGRIAVTGATGFIGSALCRHLQSEGRVVRPIGRNAGGASDAFGVGDIGAGTDWTAALAAVDCVVHCAGRAHVLRETAIDPLAEFRRVNVEGTRRLAEQAVAAGVRRFVFLSSIGVLGVHTNDRVPFRHDEPPGPVEPYAVSKLEAERELSGIAARTGLELVIVRPPLVYGPGVGANFLRLVNLVDSGWPLPFGAIQSQRSLVGMDNLVDLLMRCTDHPAAVGETFLVSDGQDIPLPELIRKLAHHLGQSARLVSVPQGGLLALARLTGKGRSVERLASALQVDIGHTRRTLAWEPPMSIDRGLAATAHWYRVKARRT
jgi:nucleoside-diphosphate-sugar epimerase